MATPKITAPSPQAFDSDPLEQIYARGILDRDMSGLAFMFANAAQDRNALSQQQYMQGMNAANAQAQQLAQQEMANERMAAVLKGALDLAKHGYLPSDMPALGAVFTDPTAASVNEPSSLANALIRAKIASENAQAARAGREGGDQYSVESGVNEMGMPTELKIKGTKSRDPQKSAALIDQMVADYMKKRAVGSGNPTAYPSIDQATKAAQEAARKRYGRISE